MRSRRSPRRRPRTVRADRKPDVRRCVDIGSGGGVPGLVVASDRPDLAVTLVDRRRKCTDFLERTTAALGWRDRVTVRCCDTDALITAGERFDAVTARGFGPPERTLAGGRAADRSGRADRDQRASARGSLVTRSAPATGLGAPPGGCRRRLHPDRPHPVIRSRWCGWSDRTISRTDVGARIRTVDPGRRGGRTSGITVFGAAHRVSRETARGEIGRNRDGPRFSGFHVKQFRGGSRMVQSTGDLDSGCSDRPVCGDHGV